MKIFVTGGAGFIGSNFIRHVLGLKKGYSIVNFDKLTYEVLDGWWTDAGTFESLLRANNLVAETGANKLNDQEKPGRQVVNR